MKLNDIKTGIEILGMIIAAAIAIFKVATTYSHTSISKSLLSHEERMRNDAFQRLAVYIVVVLMCMFFGLTVNRVMMSYSQSIEQTQNEKLSQSAQDNEDIGESDEENKEDEVESIIINERCYNIYNGVFILLGLIYVGCSIGYCVKSKDSKTKKCTIVLFTGIIVGLLHRTGYDCMALPKIECSIIGLAWGVATGLFVNLALGCIFKKFDRQYAYAEFLDKEYNHYYIYETKGDYFVVGDTELVGECTKFKLVKLEEDISIYLTGAIKDFDIKKGNLTLMQHAEESDVRDVIAHHLATNNSKIDSNTKIEISVDNNNKKEVILNYEINQVSETVKRGYSKETDWLGCVKIS